MRVLSVLCVLLVAFIAPAAAGIVIEMQVTDGRGEPSGTDTIYVSGEKIRMDPHPNRSDGEMSVIFRDNEMLLVDHDDENCQTIDKEGLDELTSQLSGAMKQLEDALANVPEAQREMMENMLRGQLPAGIGGGGEPRSIEKGGSEKVGSYSCTNHTLYVGDEKIWEVCAGDPGSVDGFSDLMVPLRAISEFTESLRDLVAETAFAGAFETPFSEIESVGGVPIRVRSYSNGRLESESTLQSISRRDVDAATFEPPEGYKVKNLADELPGR